ncbi:MAG: prolipoprotein diacylglyceryl transferase [Anaerolineales bacterium]
MLPIFHLGSLSLQTPALILLIGLWFSLSFTETFLRKNNIPFNHTQDIIFYGLIAAILGARLFYVFSYPQIFFASPQNIISLNPNLLDWWGGIIGFFLVFFILTKRHQLKPSATLDSLSVFASLFIIFGSLADLAAAKTIGLPTTLPWGIYYLGQSRHPVQIYQIIFFSWIAISLQKNFLNNYNQFVGKTTLTFIFMIATTQLVLCGFSVNTSSSLYGLRLDQSFYFIIGLISLIILLNHPKHSMENHG